MQRVLPQGDNPMTHPLMRTSIDRRGYGPGSSFLTAKAYTRLMR